VQPIAVGDTFPRWPLHVTVVPWFRLNDQTDHIVEGLTESLQPIVPFTATSEMQSMLGPRRNRPAMLLRKPTPFQVIEQRVRTYFHKKRAWLVDETTKVRQVYRPHVTFQQDERLRPGETFQCDRLYVVEQFGDKKAVVGEIILTT
jgi:hypothetical protein